MPLLHRFHELAELNQALCHFAHRFKNIRTIRRIDYRTPVAHRSIFRIETA